MISLSLTPVLLTGYKTTAPLPLLQHSSSLISSTQPSPQHQHRNKPSKNQSKHSIMPRTIDADEAKAIEETRRQMLNSIHPLTAHLPALRNAVVDKLEKMPITRRRLWYECSLKKKFDDWLEGFGKEEGARPELVLLLAAMAAHDALGHNTNSKFSRMLEERGLYRWAEEEMRARIPMKSVEGQREATREAKVEEQEEEEKVDFANLPGSGPLPKTPEKEKPMIRAQPATKRKAGAAHSSAPNKKKKAATATHSTTCQTLNATITNAACQTERCYKDNGTQTSGLSQVEELIGAAFERQNNEIQNSLNSGLRLIMENKADRGAGQGQGEMSSDEAMMRRHQQEAEFYRARMMQSASRAACGPSTSTVPRHPGVQRVPMSMAMDERTLTRVGGRAWPAEAGYRMGEEWVYESPAGSRTFRGGFC